MSTGHGLSVGQLEAMPYHKLQKLAKQYGVRAVGRDTMVSGLAAYRTVGRRSASVSPKVRRKLQPQPQPIQQQQQQEQHHNLTIPGAQRGRNPPKNVTSLSPSSATKKKKSIAVSAKATKVAGGNRGHGLSVHELEVMPYRELQELAKEYGVRAVGKVTMVTGLSACSGRRTRSVSPRPPYTPPPPPPRATSSDTAVAATRGGGGRRVGGMHSLKALNQHQHQHRLDARAGAPSPSRGRTISTRVRGQILDGKHLQSALGRAVRGSNLNKYMQAHVEAADKLGPGHCYYTRSRTRATHVDHTFECQLMGHALVQCKAWHRLIGAEGFLDGEVSKRGALDTALADVRDVQNGLVNLHMLDGGLNIAKGAVYKAAICEMYKHGRGGECDLAHDMAHKLDSYGHRHGMEMGPVASRIIRAFDRALDPIVKMATTAKTTDGGGDGGGGGRHRTAAETRDQHKRMQSLSESVVRVYEDLGRG